MSAPLNAPGAHRGAPTDTPTSSPASGPTHAPARVLVVEDEPDLRSVILAYVRAAGHVCEGQAGGADLPAVVRDFAPDLVLLDLALPDADGIALCRHLRQTSEVPVIIVTARIEEADRLLGLEVGADDYVCKPFSPRELVARIGTELRRCRPRGPGHPAHPAPLPGLHLDAGEQRARLHGADLGLTAVEFRLLQALASRPGQLWPRERLLERIHGSGHGLVDRTVDSHVRNLRRKLEAAGAPEAIQSVYGVGYRLEAP